jgi:surfactin synthase thioesterase subunit
MTRLRHPVKLLCLPHAGGCASSYREWLADLSADADVLAVQLPGRENRTREPCATEMRLLIADLLAAVRLAGLRTVALFGHSLGAVLATKLCQALTGAGIEVSHLFVSGHPGPDQIPAGHTARFIETSDDLLLETLAEMDRTITGRLADPELRAMILPLIRSDLRLVMSCRLGGEALDVPMTAFGGIDDPLLAARDLSAWASVTRAGCAAYWLPGDHFYLASQGAALAGIVRERLGSRAGASGVGVGQRTNGDYVR